MIGQRFWRANSDGYRVALDLHEAGVEVAAVVDLRPDGEPTPLGGQVKDARIEVLAGHAVYEAIRSRDRCRMRGLNLCRLDASGKPHTESLRRIECDGLAMSVGWTPNVGMAYQAGGRFRYDTQIEQIIPQNLPPTVFVAGRANGVFDLHSQIADGRRAGLAAAARCRGDSVSDVEQAEQPRAQSAHSHPYPIIAHKKKKNFVDLDEDLHLADFANAHQEGYDNIELLKRYTTVGMGPSQGKLSNMNAVRILTRLNGASIDETGTTTSRPFYHPVPIGHLAGRRFHPLRRTPLHPLHIKADAEMVHAGDWLRPEYYRASGKSPDDCILDEAQNVRRNVGLIDVSTLGKLQISGADAVRFLESIYTGRFAKQAVGSLRYGLACDETGVIIEDGVIARLAEDRFYVTATSSGASAFYRELQRWALIFKMDVTLLNATGHLAAVNIAGPNSRDVLSQLTDVDLTSRTFPYLAAREGTVADVPATILRVGFVGELGYEIHVPASCATHVWKSLLQAGQQFAVRPFGVEAQRLLRLEKGHLIVGQDTDAFDESLRSGRRLGDREK